MSERKRGGLDRFLAHARAKGFEDPGVREFPEGTKTAQDAARAIGCEVGQIVKSVVLVADGQPVVALTSGANRVDMLEVARIVGAEDVRKANADQARDATGYAIGGTPPFGYPRPVRVLMDRDLFAYKDVWAAAGTPFSVFPVSPSALQEAAGAELADFKET